MKVQPLGADGVTTTLHPAATSAMSATPTNNLRIVFPLPLMGPITFAANAYTVRTPMTST